MIVDGAVEFFMKRLRVLLIAGSIIFTAPGVSLAQIVVAGAQGEGTISSGEYAAQTFKIRIIGAYSDFGGSKLIEGRAILIIGSERFESIVSPDFGTFQSFCCGEGHVHPQGAFHSFSMTGQVRHVTAAEPHNHLFGASASTFGSMCFNLANQSGTIVTPVDPPHNPGVGLICDIPAEARLKVLPIQLSKISTFVQNLPSEMDLGSYFLNLETELLSSGDRPPGEFGLEDNFPNPFNPETNIRFQLPKASHVKMRIFNMLGKEIRVLVNAQYEAGYHSIRWDGKDKNGNSVSSGVYLYQFQAGNFTRMKKMTLMK